MEQAQQKYDLETDFSNNEDRQSIWDNKIALELETLKNWRAVEVSFILN